MKCLMASPLKISPSVLINVSAVRVEREANISESGKQVWALIQRRTALLYRKNKDIKNSTNPFLTTSQCRQYILQVLILQLFLLLPSTTLVLASPVFVDTQVLGYFHCSGSVIFFLHIVIILLLLLLMLLCFSHWLQFCPDSDEQLRLHGSPQLRCFNHSHCQE